MSSQDIRWHQRLENFEKAFSELQEAVQLSQTRELSKLEKQGLIQAFEYTHELAWNTFKDFFQDQGNTGIAGSKDATREAFKFGLVEDGENWMAMIKSRNLSTHTYNQATAELLVREIVSIYFELFGKAIAHMKQRKKNDNV